MDSDDFEGETMICRGCGLGTPAYARRASIECEGLISWKQYLSPMKGKILIHKLSKQTIE